MLKLLVDSILIFLPAMAANMAPVLAARYNWLPLFAHPIQQKYLGSNKTWRGLVVGIVSGCVAGFLQYQGHGYGIMAGGLLGLGALVGDSVKSFGKRRMNIPPGAAWLIWDQIDFVVGAAIVSWRLVPMTVQNIIIAIIILGVGSYLTSSIGVRLRIKQSI